MHSHSKNLFYLWEPVIGLEIHAQLSTLSKLFSEAPNRFGNEPNLHITEVCTGQPGSLPVLNEEAVRKAIQFGLSIGAEIAKVSTFDRKSYFYPDSPRNFQITQFENPLLRKGTLFLHGKPFVIERAHLEDDAAILKHFPTFTGIDYNRAGAPLLEIVSAPCMHSAEEAKKFAMAIRSILLYLGACNGNMAEGSFRIDVNISVRLKGETSLRPRMEIKNMNSFSGMQNAIDVVAAYQIEQYLSSPHQDPAELIFPGTYRWDEEEKKAILLRKKKSVEDYRYFPEPDLPPIVLTEEYIDALRSTLPELPHDRKRRYVFDLGLTEYFAELLTEEKRLSDYFEEALSLCNHPRLLCNWIMIEFAGRLKESNNTLWSLGIPPAHVAKLISLIEEKKITAKMAKSVADEMLLNPGIDPAFLVE